jgi:hypothetical protein
MVEPDQIHNPVSATFGASVQATKSVSVGDFPGSAAATVRLKYKSFPRDGYSSGDLKVRLQADLNALVSVGPASTSVQVVVLADDQTTVITSAAANASSGTHSAHLDTGQFEVKIGKSFTIQVYMSSASVSINSIAITSGSLSNGTISVTRECVYSTPSTVNFEKFKQLSPQLGDWGCYCLVPGPTCPGNGCQTATCNDGCPSTVGRISKYGCTLCSLSTAIQMYALQAGLPGQGITPLTVRNRLFDAGYLSPLNGRITFPMLYVQQIGSTTLYVAAQHANPSFATIVSELQAGHPVMLGVPSMNSASNFFQLVAGAKLHYVLAYAYDAQIATQSGPTHGILINDPASTVDSYGLIGQPGNVPGFNNPIPLDHAVHVSLHDYFAALSRRNTTLGANYFGCFGLDPHQDDLDIQAWYNTGVWSLQGGGGALDAENHAKLVTTVIAQTTLPPTVAPYINVSSPVEVAVTDPTNGQRYVSSASIAGPQDIVLGKLAVDVIDPPEGQDTQVCDPQFPPYTMPLPLQLYGRSLDVEVIGVGNGEFTVAYVNVGGGYVATPAITGDIQVGQTVLSHFVVEPPQGIEFCTGDSASSPCPCNNPGFEGHGCDNSASSGGGRLQALGLASVSADSLLLHAWGMLNAKPALFFQAVNQVNGGSGQTLGDGLGCISGSVISLRAVAPTNGDALYPGPNDLPVSVKGMIPAGGGTYYYHVLYRDPVTFCTPSTFNSTTALGITWIP